MEIIKEMVFITQGEYTRRLGNVYAMAYAKGIRDAIGGVANVYTAMVTEAAIKATTGKTTTTKKPVAKKKTTARK